MTMGNFLNWFVGEPKVERAIAYETRAPALRSSRLYGNLPKTQIDLNR
jgi:hypothetical protein